MNDLSTTLDRVLRAAQIVSLIVVPIWVIAELRATDKALTATIGQTVARLEFLTTRVDGIELETTRARGIQEGKRIALEELTLETSRKR